MAKDAVCPLDVVELGRDSCVSPSLLLRLHAFFVQCMRAVVDEIAPVARSMCDLDAAVGHYSSVVACRIEYLTEVGRHLFGASEGIFLARFAQWLIKRDVAK